MDETGRIKVSGFADAAALRFTIVDATERITRQRSVLACNPGAPIRSRGDGEWRGAGGEALVIIAGCNLRGGIITAFKGTRASLDGRERERESFFTPFPTSGIRRAPELSPAERIASPNCERNFFTR